MASYDPVADSSAATQQNQAPQNANNDQSIGKSAEMPPENVHENSQSEIDRNAAESMNVNGTNTQAMNGQVLQQPQQQVMDVDSQPNPTPITPTSEDMSSSHHQQTAAPIHVHTAASSTHPERLSSMNDPITPPGSLGAQPHHVPPHPLLDSTPSGPPGPPVAMMPPVADSARQAVAAPTNQSQHQQQQYGGYGSLTNGGDSGTTGGSSFPHHGGGGGGHHASAHHQHHPQQSAYDHSIQSVAAAAVAAGGLASQQGNTTGTPYFSAAERRGPPRSETWNVFVGNIPGHATETQIREFFSTCGDIVSMCVRTSTGKTTQQMQFAFINFLSQDAQAKAVEYHNCDFMGSRLLVNRQRRPGDAARESRRSLFIGNLPHNMSAEGVRMELEPTIGDILQDVRCRTGSGYCFLLFESEKDTAHAYDLLHGISVQGQTINVEYPRTKEEHAAVQAGLDPAEIDRHHRTVYINNLTNDLTETDLRALYEPYGEITIVKIPRDFNNNVRGYGFVEFLMKKSADRAQQETDGIKVKDAVIKTQISKPKVDKGFRHGYGGGGYGRRGYDSHHRRDRYRDDYNRYYGNHNNGQSSGGYRYDHREYHPYAGSGAYDGYYSNQYNSSGRDYYSSNGYGSHGQNRQTSSSGGGGAGYYDQTYPPYDPYADGGYGGYSRAGGRSGYGASSQSAAASGSSDWSGRSNGAAAPMSDQRSAAYSSSGHNGYQYQGQSSYSGQGYDSYSYNQGQNGSQSYGGYGKSVSDRQWGSSAGTSNVPYRPY